MVRFIIIPVFAHYLTNDSVQFGKIIIMQIYFARYLI